MQLRYNKYVRNKVIHIELETVNFSGREDLALKKFGEPVVVFNREYEGGFVIEIERRIKTGFKVKMKFDGSEDLTKATAAANLFFEEIKEELEEVMRELMEKLQDLEVEFKSEKGLADIKY